MKEYQSLSHTRWIVNIMWYLYRTAKETDIRYVKKAPWRVISELVSHKESCVVEGHLMPIMFTCA